MIERIEINLLPAEYRVHKRTFRIQREVIYPSLIILVTGMFLVFWSINLKATIHQVENEILAIDHQIQQNRPVQNEINRLRNDNALIQGKIRALERISVNREKWVRLMEELSGRLSDDTWLVSIKEENSTPPVLYLEGRTYSFPQVANYMSSLKGSEYVVDVGLSNIEQIDAKQKLHKFTISCTINPDVKLEAASGSSILAKRELDRE